MISSYLHGKLINWTSRFYLSFCGTVLPRIPNIRILMNRVIWIICICQLHFMLAFYVILCNFTSRGICINFDNQQQIYYLINLYFCVACMGQPRSVVTWYEGTLWTFKHSKFSKFQNSYSTLYCSTYTVVTYLVAYSIVKSNA